MKYIIRSLKETAFSLILNNPKPESGLILEEKILRSIDK